MDKENKETLMKPRIKKYKGKWYCYQGISRGEGSTPSAAFNQYKNNPSFLITNHQIHISPFSSLESIQAQNKLRTWEHEPNWERCA